MFRLSMIALLTLASINAFALEIGSQKRFYDYGNGAINLNMVTHIKPVVSYRITLASDPAEYLPQYNVSIAENVGVWFEPAIWRDEPYYFFEIGGEIRFDQFSLTTIPLTRFVKLPTTPEELKRIPNIDSFNQFLRKIDAPLIGAGVLDGHRYWYGEWNESEEQITKYGTRYAGVLEKIFPLTVDTANDMIESLKKHDKSYQRAIN